MCKHSHRHSRRQFLLTSLAASVLVACGDSAMNPAATLPVDITRDTSCALDGMLLADYPGPKAQILYSDNPEPEFFCDTVEMFSLYFAPEQARQIRAIHVQDMGLADWDSPHGHWIKAKSAYYVVGAKRHGSMGPTFVSFSKEADAQAFAKEFGGAVYPFSGITAEMTTIDGGALHDPSM